MILRMFQPIKQVFHQCGYIVCWWRHVYHSLFAEHAHVLPQIGARRVAGEMIPAGNPPIGALMPDAPRELPYPGAKEMLLVENLEDRASLAELLEAMYVELQEKKMRKR